LDQKHPIPIAKLHSWSQKTPDKPALFRCTDDRGWEAFSWAEYHQRSRDVGAALLATGHQPGECVVILSANRAEWLFTQWGIMMAAGVCTPCYMTNPPEQVSYQAGHCGARLVFVENAGQLAKVAQVRGELAKLELAIVYDPTGIEAIDGVSADWVIGFDDFLARAEQEHHTALDERITGIDRGADAFIIYTSGTTGQPKAVVISHENLAGGGVAILNHYPATFTRTVCYLPLCHIAEQSATNLVQLETGGEVYLCPEFNKLPEYLKDVRPSTMFGVPRVWEKVEATLKSSFKKLPERKQRLLKWARDVERDAVEQQARTGREQRSFKRWFANKTVLGGVKKRMGIENVEYFLTGAAPISAGTLGFFASLGVHINEVYGLSETGGMLTATMPNEVCLGTVGKPMLGVEIDIAEDGEILARGPSLSRGYLHDPESTTELWEGGWMHTGDIGSFDERGNLRITDRKKDLIINAQAKNIAPQPIEAKLTKINGISHAVVVGDRRKYLVALFTVDEVTAAGLASELGAGSADARVLAKDPAFLAYLQGELDKVNQTLARYEQIKRFEVLPQQFSIETGELTPTMKLKRRVVVTRNADLIDQIYDRPR